MDKNTLRLGWWLLGGLLFGAAAFTGVLLGKELEYKFLPVVTEVRITRSETDGSGTLIWGTFDKQRNCRFVEASVNAGALLLDLEFLDERLHRAVTRPVGPQVFGPWRISPNVFPLRITVRHECHPLWFSTTTLIEGFKP